MRLTGPVPIENEEFATVREGAAANGTVTLAVVLLILWLALKSFRIIVAVVIALFIGLSITAALGLLMVGALNLDLGCVCRAVRRPGRRFRHPVQRPLSPGAVQGADLRRACCRPARGPGFR